ncbi:tryptophan synthase subunit beta [Pseudomonas eucalypticola]|uniref:Tryptophan synthase subunit beta n=1 Tax=Pseudomonas eucalypticola TaxID=2599595 RepID=A0A7D5DC62_9PSED|nr:tryptophan synthase subunit beta [Pseudomonas eucalypticola]QKZ07818.1 tryptophan synthase subunit beta [Pseudomonas eucalypticola]
MYYVQRNALGHIIRADKASYPEAEDFLVEDHPDILAWMARGTIEGRLQQLRQSDMEMIRVLDDLIQVLTSKGVIRITDLPEAALAKLKTRNEVRGELGGLDHLVDDPDDALL